MQNFEFFHGAALIKIIHSGCFKIVENFSKSNAAYLIDEKIGLYIKYSQKRMSPWVFTFDKEHVKEIKDMNDLLSNIFNSAGNGNSALLPLTATLCFLILPAISGSDSWNNSLCQ